MINYITHGYAYSQDDARFELLFKIHEIYIKNISLLQKHFTNMSFSEIYGTMKQVINLDGNTNMITRKKVEAVVELYGTEITTASGTYNTSLSGSGYILND